MKSDKELAQIFKDKNIDTTKMTINSCGSGVTACIVETAMRIMGAEKTAIYDGSWTEYGMVDEPDFKQGAKHGWDESGKSEEK